MTQTERVIRAAKSFQGVCQTDFLGPDTVDGGPPITRVAARLWDAEQQGYSFECIGWRNKCKCFRLVDVDSNRRVQDSPSDPTVAVNTGEPEGLFEVRKGQFSFAEQELV